MHSFPSPLSPLPLVAFQEASPPGAEREGPAHKASARSDILGFCESSQRKQAGTQNISTYPTHPICKHNSLVPDAKTFSAKSDRTAPMLQPRHLSPVAHPALYSEDPRGSPGKAGKERSQEHVTTFQGWEPINLPQNISQAPN